MSEYIHKSHNVTVLLYHLVFPAKYRRAVFDKEVDKELKEVCLDIEKRYEIKFLEIGTDKDHVHFLVQSVPMYSVTRLEDDKELDGKGNISALSKGKEAITGSGSFGRTATLAARLENMEMKR